MRKSVFILFIGLLLISVAWIGDFSALTDNALPAKAEKLAQDIEFKKQEAQDEIDLAKERFNEFGVDSTMVEFSDQYAALYNEKGLFLAAFEDNELVFYSDNRVAFDYLFGPGIPDEQYLRLENGWYGLIKQIDEDREYYALFLIRTAYPYKNAHLQDDFQHDFGLGPNYNLSVREQPGYEPVYVDGETVFYLFRTEVKSTGHLWVNFVLLIFGLAFLALGGTRLFTQQLPFAWATATWPLVLIGLRLLSLQVSTPFAESKLFDPALYATSFVFGSLGDFLINGILIAFVAFFLFRQFERSKTRHFSWLWGTVALLALFAFSLFITPLTIGLIENSRINFNLHEVFHLDVYTLIGLVSIGLLLYAFYLGGAAVLQMINWRKPGLKKLSLLILLVIVLHVVAAHVAGIVDFKLMLWPLPFILLVATIHFSKTGQLSVRAVVMLLFYSSVIVALALLKYNGLKERSERMVYAEKLASDEDPVTELVFSSVANNLREDKRIRELLSQPDRYSNSTLAEEIERLFIDRYWNKYDLKIHTYLPSGNYWGALPESRPPNLEAFDQLIVQHGYPSSTSPHLYHLYNYPENLSYLAKVPLFENDTTQLAWVVIGLESTIFPDEIGFPRLLIDDPIDPVRNIDRYSFARYIDEKLVSASGEYNYRVNTTLYRDNQERFSFEDYKDHNHLIYRVDDRTLVVVSVKKLTFFDEVTVFSYVFALFGLGLLLLLYIQNPKVIQPGFFNHLNVKVQLLSTGIILVALLSFGIATRFYIENQLHEKNQSILSEKIQSVLIELDDILRNEDHLTEPVVDQLKSTLTKLSYVFFTDINVYNPEGHLVATSQPKIYETGLVAPRMNAEALVKVTINKKSDYIHQETIGTLNYLSAYVPYRNQNNDIVAYINLPYFARQDALEEEYTGLLITLVNLFVLLVALSIVAAFFITDWITRPLQKLQQSLSRIELGRRNEQIEYKGSDVIANLVNEYNRKVTELEINADQLARSERESAWREMARQVAHEIKNPLTPMKLNIQLLQRAASEGAEDLESRFERTAETLIEQIDTLSEIASAFSNFAKMPRAELAEVNLNKLISSAVDLYDDLPGGRVEFTPFVDEQPIVRADYNQLLRAVQNLIQNALQAGGEDSDILIQIGISTSDTGFVMRVKDNGNGIPEELRDRIFQPNFTTKSTGMGLGLAMVSSIVQNVNGRIWFETETGIGTTFYIEIPTLKKN